MAKVPKLIKAVVDFSKKMPEQLFASAQTVWTGLNGNVNFTNLPVDLNVFKAKLDAYSVSIGRREMAAGKPSPSATRWRRVDPDASGARAARGAEL